MSNVDKLVFLVIYSSKLYELLSIHLFWHNLCISYLFNPPHLILIQKFQIYIIFSLPSLTSTWHWKYCLGQNFHQSSFHFHKKCITYHKTYATEALQNMLEHITLAQTTTTVAALPSQGKCLEILYRKYIL